MKKGRKVCYIGEESGNVDRYGFNKHSSWNKSIWLRYEWEGKGEIFFSKMSIKEKCSRRRKMKTVRTVK